MGGMGRGARAAPARLRRAGLARPADPHPCQHVLQSGLRGRRPLRLWPGALRSEAGPLGRPRRLRRECRRRHTGVVDAVWPVVSVARVFKWPLLPARIGRRGGAGVPMWGVLAAAVVVAEIALWRWKWSMSATTVLSTLIAAMAVVTVAEHLRWPGRFRSAWLGWGACLLAAGIACRQSDVARSFPVGPDSWLQGHALWHLLTAAALATLYLHERSEQGARLHERSEKRESISAPSA